MTVNPTILLTNYHSSLNAGDRAMLECTLDQLRACFEKPKFILAMNWPDERIIQADDLEIIASPQACAGGTRRTTALWQLLSVLKWGTLASLGSTFWNHNLSDSNWRRLLAAYQAADLVIGVAGLHFFSMGRLGWPFPASALAVALAHTFKKPFYTFPQSIGPLRRSWERQWVRSLYRKARLLQIRDMESERLAQQLGLANQVVFTPDPAFAITPASQDEGCAILGKYGYQPGTFSIGTTVLARMGNSLAPGMADRYYEIMVEIFKRLITAYGADIFLFVQVFGPTPMEDDSRAAREIMRQMGHLANHIHLVDERLTPAQLKSCYGLMDFFIPTRLHSGIFALSMNVPCFYLGYLSKIRGVMEIFGLADCVIDFKELEVEKFWTRLEAAIQTRHVQSAQIAKLLPAVIDNSRKAGDKIYQDYTHAKR